MFRLESLIAWVLPLLFVACSSGDETGDSPADSTPERDNMSACEEWVAAMSCGGEKKKGFDCKSYADVACDIIPYFDCLTANTICDEKTGSLDTSGWGKCMGMDKCP
jgi:hypothetical protein